MLFTLHVSTVLLSFLLFNLRAYGVVTDGAWRNMRVLKILPHMNDSLLLATAIGLSIQINQYPLLNNWLTVKLIFLLLYIVLGLLFMRWAKTRAQRASLYVLSMTCFAFIVSVAVSHNPWGVFAVL